MVSLWLSIKLNAIRNALDFRSFIDCKDLTDSSLELQRATIKKAHTTSMVWAS